MLSLGLDLGLGLRPEIWGLGLEGWGLGLGVEGWGLGLIHKTTWRFFDHFWPPPQVTERNNGLTPPPSLIRSTAAPDPPSKMMHKIRSREAHGAWRLCESVTWFTNDPQVSAACSAQSSGTITADFPQRFSRDAKSRGRRWLAGRCGILPANRRSICVAAFCQPIADRFWLLKNAVDEAIKIARHPSKRH